MDSLSARNSLPAREAATIPIGSYDRIARYPAPWSSAGAAAGSPAVVRYHGRGVMRMRAQSRSEAPMAHGLLSGLQVLEYARGPGAAYCGRVLAEAGADVVSVEPPGGSELRRLGPFVGDEPGLERGLAYLYTATNKRSVTLDPGTNEGRALFLRLLSRADALIEDAEPGLLAALGIDDDAVAAARPGLVWTSLTAFGQTGPYRDLPWSSLTLQALSGWLSLSGEPQREPVQTGGRLAEMAPGLLAAVATLGEIIDQLDDEPHADPRPRRADVSSLELMTALHPPFELGVSYKSGGPAAKRLGNRIPSTHPFTVKPCATGHAAVLHLTYPQWELITQLMEAPELLDDPALQTGAGRVANYSRVDEALQPWLSARPSNEVFHTGQSWRLPFAEVVNAADIYASPQHAARGWFRELEHPEAGRYRAPGPAFRPEGEPETPDRTAPRLGQDNAAVFGAIGLAPADVAALAEAGVI
jgi:CoA:oxalate CoA-transferase